jgi:hypothetical protein
MSSDYKGQGLGLLMTKRPSTTNIALNRFKINFTGQGACASVTLEKKML